MSTLWKFGFARTVPDTRHCYGGFRGGLQKEKAPTDFLFRTDIRLLSPRTGFAYRLEDKNDVLIQQGALTTSPTVIASQEAFTESDVVKLHWLSYGYQYQSVQIGMTRISTSAFMFQLANTNAEASSAPLLADVAATTFDKINKEVTFTASVSQTRAYSVLQHLQSQAVNAELLPLGQIFSTVLGNTFNLKSDWKMRFTAAPTGAWNISGGQVIFDFAGTAFSNFNYDSTLYFDDGADSSVFTFTNSSIPTVDVVAGYAGVGGITVVPAGTTPIPSNLSPANITVSSPPIALTVTVRNSVTKAPILGANVYLHKDGDPLTVYLNGATDVNGKITTNIQYDADTDVTGWAREFDLVGSDYVQKDIAGTYTSNGFSIIVELDPI